jgi:RNA polymerase sigma-70 factor (ECF subfamily)
MLGLVCLVSYSRAVTAWWPKLVDAASPAAREVLGAPGVTQKIAGALAAARARFPEATVGDDDFARAIGERLGAQKDPAAALARLRADDLLLAQWCASGDPRAIAAFEQVHRADVDAVLARFKRLAITADELRQTLRIKLFVAVPGRAARIADYSGFGFLQNWLRVTALRALVDVARSERARKLEELLADEDMVGMPELGPDLSARVSREQVNRAIKQALAHAVASLAPRQRNFLRHAHVDQLTLDQIASTYNIHRATVARTLASAREDLVKATRAALAEILGVTADSLDSVVRGADSKIDLSLSRILRAPEADFAE